MLTVAKIDILDYSDQLNTNNVSKHTIYSYIDKQKQNKIMTTSTIQKQKYFKLKTKSV